MMRFRSTSLLALLISLAWGITATRGADIAIVDYADQWTGVDGLRVTLDEFGIEYDDLTLDVENGELPLTDQKVLFLGSMVTNNPLLHQSLDQNAEIIQDFVANGGVVIEPTQADQNEDGVDWLPDGLVCVRGDTDSADFTIREPEHPLFNNPNRLREEEFAGWGHQRWPTVWERIVFQRGFDVLADSEGRPAILEATFGRGKFVLMSLAPDKYHVAGNDDHTKEMAGLFLENILETYLPEETREERLRRGDSDANGDTNLTDAVYVLNHLFLGGPAPECPDAADANDSGDLNLTDAVYTLNWLFLGGAPPPSPGPGECGLDPTRDELIACDYDPGNC